MYGCYGLVLFHVTSYRGNHLRLYVLFCYIYVANDAILIRHFRFSVTGACEPKLLDDVQPPSSYSKLSVDAACESSRCLIPFIAVTASGMAASHAAS
jgi:hypothetical protein